VNKATRRVSGAIILTEDSRFVLQRRDNDPTIKNPGMVSLFGGHLDAEESFESAIRRELYEELHLRLNADELFCVQVSSAVEILECAYFLVEGVEAGAVISQEGEAIIVMERDFPWPDMTPLCAFGLRMFLDSLLVKEREAA
jgi:8-oxo-dGTP pyrophosphatase MutT (NUDIX family)